MASYIAVLLDVETDEPVTTVVIEAVSDVEACIKASEAADRQGLVLGDIVRRF